MSCSAVSQWLFLIFFPGQKNSLFDDLWGSGNEETDIVDKPSIVSREESPQLFKDLAAEMYPTRGDFPEGEFDDMVRLLS